MNERLGLLRSKSNLKATVRGELACEVKGLLYWSGLDQQLEVVSMYSCAYSTLIIFLKGLTVIFQASDEQPRRHHPKAALVPR